MAEKKKTGTSPGHEKEATFEETFRYLTMRDVNGDVITPDMVTPEEVEDWKEENGYYDDTPDEEFVATGEDFQRLANPQSTLDKEAEK